MPSSAGTLEHLNYFTQHKFQPSHAAARKAFCAKKKQRHELVQAACSRVRQNQNVIVRNATKHETSRNLSV